MADHRRGNATIRDAQKALESLTRETSISAPWSPMAENRGGVTWQIPSELERRQMAPYPHTTGPNPNAPADTIGARHHLTTIRDTPGAADLPQVERSGSGSSSPVANPSPWQIVERVHHEVLPGGSLGPARHDQHLAINMLPNATGAHEVRSATVRAATHSDSGEAVIRTDSVHQPVSPRTARRVLGRDG